MNEEEKSYYLSVVDWVIEHYPYYEISSIFDISLELVEVELDLDEEDEEDDEDDEETRIIFDEYVRENYKLQQGGKTLFYTEEDYERIENNKESLKEGLEEQGHSSSHLD